MTHETSHFRIPARPLLFAVCLSLSAPLFAQANTAATGETGASDIHGIQNAQAMSTSKTDDSPATSKAPSKPILKVSNQSVANKQIMIREIQMPKSGWVVVHYREKNGQLSVDPIGTLHLGAGTYEDVLVTLTAPVTTGEKLVVMLHQEDANAPESASYGNSDRHQPIRRANGKIVKAAFKINKPADKDAQQHTATSSGHVGNKKESQAMQ